MKNVSGDCVHKEVVIVGNGPSGISMSYMLAGNLPFVVSNDHPDEMLSIRLRSTLNQNLIYQDLGYLAEGLEGRTTNPVSLLLDALVHPCADIGIETEPVVEWRKCEPEIDHIVVGKGPPGGAWHKMDPNILTLSLGSWMALPGMAYQSRDSGEKRAIASNVAQYYQQYVDKMNLTRYFRSGATVTRIRPLNDQEQNGKMDCDIMETNQSKVNGVPEKPDFCLEPEIKECLELEKEKESCLLANALNFILLRNRKPKANRCCKRPRDSVLKHDLSPDRKVRDMLGVESSQETRSTHEPLVTRKNTTCSLKNCNPLCNFPINSSLQTSRNLDFSLSQVPCYPKTPKPDSGNDKNWLVEVVDNESGERTTYLCKYLVLACGASDLPNRLNFPADKDVPGWILHDLRSLELELDRYKEEEVNEDGEMDPVLVVGAGLSAADAVIATRGRNIPVVHIFRNKSAGLNKQLPENMYPEYHKVHQMMKDGGSSYPLYTALREYRLTNFDSESKLVTLTSSTGEHYKYRVSFVAVLIGSRPDLSFLPPEFNLGVNKTRAVDCKTNTLDIDKYTHCVHGFENLFALGPLTGDNFVRFIPGGALAIVSELKRRMNC